MAFQIRLLILSPNLYFRPNNYSRLVVKVSKMTVETTISLLLKILQGLRTVMLSKAYMRKPDEKTQSFNLSEFELK